MTKTKNPHEHDWPTTYNGWYHEQLANTLATGAAAAIRAVPQDLIDDMVESQLSRNHKDRRPSREERLQAYANIIGMAVSMIADQIVSFSEDSAGWTADTQERLEAQETNSDIKRLV